MSISLPATRSARLRFGRFARGAVVLLVATGISAGLVLVIAPRGTEVRRRFMPGPLGAERGAPPPPPTALAYRTRTFTGVEQGEAAVWAAENGLGPSPAFSHHLAAVFPPELARTHPEFFPLVAEERMVPTAGVENWNPDLGRADVAVWAAAAARRHFQAKPADETFSAGVNDGLIFGESPETLARVTPPRWFRGRPDYSNLVFTFLNRTAAELAKTHPDKFLGALAYYWCEQTPDFAVHPGVMPFLTADRSQGYDKVWLAEEQALQRRWAQAGPQRLGLYDYLYGQGFLVPRVTPRLIAENIRAARQLGFTDYFAEVNPNWGLDGPMPWLVAQLLQDPALRLEALLDEYYARYFQAAGRPMRRFFERCEAQWLAQSGPPYWLKHFRNESQATLFPPEVCRELRGLLDAAERAAQSEPVRARVRFTAEAFRVTEGLVDLQWSRAALGRWLATSDRRAADGRELLAGYRAARRRFGSTIQAVTRSAEGAIAPVNQDDFLRDDPTFAATVALAGAFDLSGESGLESRVQAGRDFVAARSGARLVERLTDGSLEDVPAAPRVIAGLAHGLGLPSGWQSRVEPTQAHRAGLGLQAACTGLQGLDVAGATNTTMYRWLPAKPGVLHAAAVQVRGRVSAGNAVTLILGWMDARQRAVGTTLVARLPDGDWAEWITLRQGGWAPADAAWVGIGIRIQNQVSGDWVHFDDFSLTEAAGK